MEHNRWRTRLGLRAEGPYAFWGLSQGPPSRSGPGQVKDLAKDLGDLSGLSSPMYKVDKGLPPFPHSCLMS